MGKIKGNGKEVYRKKPYTSKFQKHLDKDYKRFLEGFTEISEQRPEHIIGYLVSWFGISGIGEEKNPDLKAIVFCKNDGLREMLIDLGNKGANLRIICDALKIPDIPEYLLGGHPSGLELYDGRFSPLWNEQVEQYKRKRAAFGKSVRKIKEGLSCIKSLELIPEKIAKFIPYLPISNARLKAVRKAIVEFEKGLNDYLAGKAIQEGLIGYPAKWGIPIEKLLETNFHPVTQRSHHLFDEKIPKLVQELRDIGFSHNESYKKTAILLHLAFPFLYQDNDADLVRRRYSSLKKRK